MEKKWVANWIGFRECPKSTAPVFRKRFVIEKIPECCQIFITGLGAYFIKINGLRVDADILQPAYSNYDRTVYYNEYDIRKYIVKGENSEDGVRFIIYRKTKKQKKKKENNWVKNKGEKV